VTIDPLTVGVPILLTIVYGVKFLVGGFENVRSKFPTFALILSIIWILPFFFKRRDFASFLIDPNYPRTPVSWAHTAVVLMVPIAWGLLIYFLMGD
jgi:hypothetical protein